MWRVCRLDAGAREAAAAGGLAAHAAARAALPLPGARHVHRARRRVRGGHVLRRLVGALGRLDVHAQHLQEPHQAAGARHSPTRPLADSLLCVCIALVESLREMRRAERSQWREQRVLVRLVPAAQCKQQ